jgi:hypothetical protein
MPVPIAFAVQPDATASRAIRSAPGPPDGYRTASERSPTATSPAS